MHWLAFVALHGVKLQWREVEAIGSHSNLVKKIEIGRDDEVGHQFAVSQLIYEDRVRPQVAVVDSSVLQTIKGRDKSREQIS